MGKYNKQAPGDTPGYVYLLHCENGLYKVGRSAWPETRVTELRHQNGIRGTLLWKLQCADMVTTRAFLPRPFLISIPRRTSRLTVAGL